MNILGLGGSTHDYAACLLSNGVIKFMVEEERLSRIKHSLVTNSLDVARCLAADYCLNESGLHRNDIDIVIGNDILHPLYYSKYKSRINHINHHLAHASSTFFVSPFKNASILVADGVGSYTGKNQRETVSFYFGEDNKIINLGKIKGECLPYPNDADCDNSIGAFYYDITTASGFGMLQEGKTMGLAPFGSDLLVNTFYDFYTLDKTKFFIRTREQRKRQSRFINEYLSGLAGAPLFLARQNIAYAGQFHLERIIIHLANCLYDMTKCPDLCLAGGVFLNSVANQKILDNTPFERIFVQPAAGDAGTALGSALFAYYVNLEQPRIVAKIPFSPFLGKSYSNDQYKETIEMFSNQIEVTESKDIYLDTAKLLADGLIIGWFQGRSEIGPRALGQRSILADPRSFEMKDKLNLKVKHRERFRPFAPIVLEEDQAEYFTSVHPSYYMLMVTDVLEQKRDIIPAVTHVDESARMQTVNDHLSPELHKLLRLFKNITGVSVLLNTSFNDNNEPIVESPKDALQCFLKTDLDILVLGSYLIRKRVSTNSDGGSA
ncbi:MAG: carbamoyltransferase family protein [Bacillota bacterium]